MGNLKDEALNNQSEDTQVFDLNDDEMGYIRLLNMALQFHSLGQKIISGFMYYVATHRLGYTEGVNLQFEMDLAKEDNKLTIKLLPAMPVTPPETPTKNS